MIEITLKIDGRKETIIPIEEEHFNPQTPIVVKLLREGKVKVFTLRLTNKRSLVLN
jgi:hypothetical protein